MPKDKPITETEARKISARLIARLAYHDAEASRKFSHLVPYDSKPDLDRIEEQFYKWINWLDSR